jgi:formyltetrahydrofolate-dependent phosphoribosylglycinamide formyltransferase
MASASPLSPPTTTYHHPLRLGVLISGGGTTLCNLAATINAGRLEATIACVISSKADVLGIRRAAEFGLPAFIVTRKEYPSREAFSNAITTLLRQHQVDLVCMAGFLALWQIPEEYLNPPRVMNIHPALIPNFCGKGMHGHHVHEAVLAAGAKVSGCTVHFADNQYDHGPIILQRTCPVLPGDTPDTLAARVFEQECQAYPEAIRLFAAGRLRVSNGNVDILT